MKIRGIIWLRHIIDKLAFKHHKKPKQPFLGRGSVEAFVAYFDTHDLGDELDGLSEAQFDVDIQARKHLVTLDDDIAEQVGKIAVSWHIPSEALINAWLREKIMHLGTA